MTTFTKEQLDDLAYRCGKGWVIHNWEIRILIDMARLAPLPQSASQPAEAAAGMLGLGAGSTPASPVPSSSPAPDPWPYGAPYPWNQRTP